MFNTIHMIHIHKIVKFVNTGNLLKIITIRTYLNMYSKKPWKVINDVNKLSGSDSLDNVRNEHGDLIYDERTMNQVFMYHYMKPFEDVRSKKVIKTSRLQFMIDYCGASPPCNFEISINKEDIKKVRLNL